MIKKYKNYLDKIAQCLDIATIVKIRVCFAIAAAPFKHLNDL